MHSNIPERSPWGAKLKTKVARWRPVAPVCNEGRLLAPSDASKAHAVADLCNQLNAALPPRGELKFVTLYIHQAGRPDDIAGDPMPTSSNSHTTPREPGFEMAPVS